eukprot:m.65057 g.65057  ORF g.65057 m.65057 type:complete len:172 (-) comp7552_c0_seq1:1419-1934(-)
MTLERDAVLTAARDGRIGDLTDLLATAEGREQLNVRIATLGSHAPLTAACWFGQLEAARLLVREGADPAMLAGDGQTALHTAATYGHLPVVQWLVDDVAVDVNAKDQYGETALDAARSAGHDAVCAFLKDKGATATRPDPVAGAAGNDNDDDDEDGAALPPELAHLLQRAA